MKKKDSIALAFFGFFILAGWGARYYFHSLDSTSGITIHRNAVEVPAATSGFVKININLASQSELERLPGIGPVKANDIVEYREKHGFFKETSDIVRVKGIGPVTAKKILPYIVSGEETEEPDRE